MDIEGIMLSEMSKKDKYCMISLVCGIFKNLKKKKNPQAHREWTGGYQRQWERGRQNG